MSAPGLQGVAKEWFGVAPSYRAKRAARFWAYVDRSGGPNACWPWHGPERWSKGKPTSYGVTSWKGHQAPAHRVAWILENGIEPPYELVIDHMCECKWCVNPDHLQPVTSSENKRRRYHRPPEFSRTRTSFESPFDDRWYPFGRRKYDAQGNRLEPRDEAPEPDDYSEPADRDEPTWPTIPLGTPGFTMGIDGPPLIPDDEEF